MINKLNYVLELVISRLKEDDNVRGALLYGSLARGQTHPYSDIDLMVIVKEGPSRTLCTQVEGVSVQMIERQDQEFKTKTCKPTRNRPISRDFRVVLDKEGWIESFIDSDQVREARQTPLALGGQEALIKKIDFKSSLHNLRGLMALNKETEIRLHLGDYIYLGLELLYDHKGWFLESRKNLLQNFKSRMGGKDIVDRIYKDHEVTDQVIAYEDFYNYILDHLDPIPSSYELFW